ncbi:MAG: cupredoxin domain-containing protein [Fimbriimonadales bacterium]
MKNIITTALALIAGASLLGFASTQDSCCSPNASIGSEEPMQARADKGVQKATVTVDGGFSPSTISVKAGKPVQLTFDTKSRGCADEVVFESPKMRKALTNGTKTVVTFTPKKAGTYAFGCPMGMYKGKVVAK